ncbi:MAG: RluA family pseudouridine synthase [Christensenellales bacterium]|jgi:23S rRNA pseudouridine1911/1915/1917 synthase
MTVIEKHLIIAEECDSGVRLDKALSAQLEEFTRSRLAKLIEDNLVSVNGESKKSNYKVRAGDRIEISVPEPETLSLEPENIPLDIVYEDDYFAVINKPRGMVTHPAPGALSGTLVNALLFHLKSLSSINGVVRPGIVHRLDKDTTGLIAVAKRDDAHLSLQQQIAEKSAKRIYRALVDGVMKNDSGVIEAPIARSMSDRKKMSVSKNGRYARTDYSVIRRFNLKTYAEFNLYTGRTHQIRVHMKHIGHPVSGDKVYGGDARIYGKGQLLHAYKLILKHPKSGETMEFLAPLPEDFEALLMRLE